MITMNTTSNRFIRLITVVISLGFLIFQLQAQNECSSFGWANFEGQSEKGPVTGGGDAVPIEVTSFSALKSAVESSDANVIHILNDVGNGYIGTSGDVLKFKSNKTVIGMKPQLTVKCSFQISGASNIIIRNLIVRGPGNTNSQQNWDAVTIQQGANRIWFDHCTIMEGEDGNFDVVKGADNVTATWCKYTYVSGGAHNLSNLVGSSDNEPQSHGKLNITYAYCWWDNVNSRCPRTRYGKIHVLNCYYNKVGSGAYAGKMSNIRVEGCYFENNVSNPTGLISTNGQAGVFAIDCNRGATKTDGYNTVFEPPYEYVKYDNSEVREMVTAQAGPTLTDPTDCGTTRTGLKKHSKVNEIAAVPSYFNNHIQVKVNRRQGDEIRMTLNDVSGRTIIDKRRIRAAAGNSSIVVNANNIKSGIYILSLHVGDRIQTQKIIKNR